MTNERPDRAMTRQDLVDNTIHEALNALCGRELPWDIELIGEIRDSIERAFEMRGIMRAEEFYP